MRSSPGRAKITGVDVARLVRFALVVSVVAVLAAVIATSLTPVSDTAVVLVVITASFLASWVYSGRTAERGDTIVLPVRSVGSRAA